MVAVYCLLPAIHCMHSECAALPLPGLCTPSTVLSLQVTPLPVIVTNSGVLWLRIKFFRMAVCCTYCLGLSIQRSC